MVLMFCLTRCLSVCVSFYFILCVYSYEWNTYSFINMTVETTKSIGESIMQFAQFSIYFQSLGFILTLDHAFAADCAD